jgi:hypothetical protein
LFCAWCKSDELDKPIILPVGCAGNATGGFTANGCESIKIMADIKKVVK